MLFVPQNWFVSVFNSALTPLTYSLNYSASTAAYLVCGPQSGTLFLTRVAAGLCAPSRTGAPSRLPLCRPSGGCFSCRAFTGYLSVPTPALVCRGTATVRDCTGLLSEPAPAYVCRGTSLGCLPCTSSLLTECLPAFVCRGTTAPSHPSPRWLS